MLKHSFFIFLTFCFINLATAQEVDFTMLTTALENVLPNDEAGAVIGFIDGTEEHILVVSNPSFDEHTLFEYGSITKVFTAILLQQLANENLVNLDDNVRQYISPELNVEQWQHVSLKHLATHTAGIPSLPPNLNPILVWLLGRNNDPFARYDEAKLYKGVEAVRIEGTGEVWEYSNFGFGLLGYLLASASGQSYEQLLFENILRPLDMASASTTEFSSSNIAPPLKSSGAKGTNMFFNALASAGVIKGSTVDAMKFLNTAMQSCCQEDALSIAICQSIQSADINVNETETQSLGWLRSAQSKREIVWHNGGTRGYSSFLGFVPETNLGLVILTNVADIEVDEPALAFLNSF